MQHDSKKTILLRADDLGYSKGVNYGIKRCVDKKTIRTVGLIVNLNDSQHGFDLIKDADLCLGLHVNITYGKPLADPKQVPSLLQPSGVFRSSKAYPCMIDYEEVYKEVEKQYERFLEITQRMPDYIEGHAILDETFLKAIEEVAKKHQILYVPSIPNPDQPAFLHGKPTYFWLESMQKDYDPAQTFKRVSNIQREGCEVIIFHPGFVDDDLMNRSSLLLPRVKEVCFLTAEDLIETITSEPNRFITYREL